MGSSHSVTISKNIVLLIHNGLWKKILLVKMQTNVNQRQHIHNNICQKFLTQLKRRILTIKIGVIFFVKEAIFLREAEQFPIFLHI